LTTLWQDFQSYVSELLKKEFSDFSIQEQYIQVNGLRPDFILEKPDVIGVVEAKEKRNLSKSDINQMRDYIYELESDFAKIYVSTYTKISENVLKLASKYSIEIIRTKWNVQTFYDRLGGK